MFELMNEAKLHAPSKFMFFLYEFISINKGDRVKSLKKEHDLL